MAGAVCRSGGRAFSAVRQSGESGGRSCAQRFQLFPRFPLFPEKMWDKMASCPTNFHRFRASQREMKATEKSVYRFVGFEVQAVEQGFAGLVNFGTTFDPHIN